MCGDNASSAANEVSFCWGLTCRGLSTNSRKQTPCGQVAGSSAFNRSAHGTPTLKERNGTDVTSRSRASSLRTITSVSPRHCRTMSVICSSVVSVVKREKKSLLITLVERIALCRYGAFHHHS
uniref:Uncharacterized protein n=1 Tax=Anopheles albimanus TaxID=7167 RepID=A0A182FZM6_ANOAL